MAINDLLFRPAWFILTESIFGIISMIVTFLISLYAYKIYWILSNKKYLFMAVAFFSISLGFLGKTISDMTIIYYDFLIKLLPSFFRLAYIYTGSLLLYSFLVLSGYVLLACLAMDVKKKGTILALCLIAFLCSILIRRTSSFTFFYFSSFVLLAVYIVPYMYENYKKQRTRNAYRVYLSFLLLAIASFFFIGITIHGSYLLYILGNLLNLSAYLLLLINSISVSGR